MKFEEVEIKAFSKDLVRSAGQLDRLCRLEEALNEVKGEGVAVISGGFVRDTILGLPPRDLDVFVRPSDDWDPADYPVWMALEIARKLPGEYLKEGINSPEYAAYNQSETKAAITSIVRLHSRVDFAYLEITGRDDFTDGPSLVETFDNDLVKCYFADGKILAESAFLQALRVGRVNSRDRRTERRLKDWRERTGYKITIGRPPEEKAKNTSQIQWYTQVANTTDAILDIRMWDRVAFDHVRNQPIFVAHQN